MPVLYETFSESGGEEQNTTKFILWSQNNTKTKAGQGDLKGKKFTD